MSNNVVKAAIIPTLLISLCTNIQGLSTNTSENTDLFQERDSSLEIDHIKTETVQLLELLNDPGNLMINVAGEPGVHFQIHFSPTGEKDSYTLIDNGESVIGSNSFVSLTVDIKALKHDTVFLNMFSNDDGDFSKIGRKISEPIAISLKDNRIYVASADTNSTDGNATNGAAKGVTPKGGRCNTAMGVRG